MQLVIDLADRVAVRRTYSDCQGWREKGGVLRGAAPTSAHWDPTLLIPRRQWHRVLELGCGLRQWVRGLIASAASDGVIYACDLNEDVLRVFSRELVATWSNAGQRYRCVLGDGENLPFSGGSFDGISAVFVGPHMNEAKTFVGGLARILSPDGWLLTNSVDWSNPPPDFPSQALQELLGEPASFVVRNAFNEASARKTLNRYFSHVRENRVTVPATLHSAEQVMRLHSRQEHFIRLALPPRLSWDDYVSCVESIAAEYIRQNGSYHMDLPITYFLAERPLI